MGGSLNSEIILFLISVVSGVCAGILFDLFRSFRKMEKANEGRVAFEDILLWISEAALVFSLLYKYNSGGVRFYFFIGLTLGSLLYYFTISKYVVLILTAIFSAFKIICIKIIAVLKKIIVVLFLPITFSVKKTVCGARKIKTKSKKLKKQLKMY